MVSVLVGAVGLQEARSAVDRAFQTEMAGDYKGARTALEGLLRSSTEAEDEAARALLRRHLEEMEVRRRAHEAHGATARGFVAQFETLRERPVRWQNLLWDEAVRSVPELEGTAELQLAWDRLDGLPLEAVQPKLVSRLRRTGVAVRSDEANLIARVQVEASEPKAERHRFSVEVEASYVLKSRAPRRALSSRVHRHRESRTGAEAAQEWVTRRVMDEVAHSLIFDIRLHRLLEQAGL